MEDKLLLYAQRIVLEIVVVCTCWLVEHHRPVDVDGRVRAVHLVTDFAKHRLPHVLQKDGVALESASSFSDT